MKLFEIRTDYTGESYERCYVWAPGEILAREAFGKLHVDRKIETCEQILTSENGPFITGLSNSGFGAGTPTPDETMPDLAEYHPSSLVVDCGDMRIETAKRQPGGPIAGMGATITMDGKQITNVRSIDVRIVINEIVTVTVERMPEARE